MRQPIVSIECRKKLDLEEGSKGGSCKRPAMHSKESDYGEYVCAEKEGEKSDTLTIKKSMRNARCICFPDIARGSLLETAAMVNLRMEKVVLARQPWGRLDSKMDCCHHNFSIVRLAQSSSHLK